MQVATFQPPLTNLQAELLKIFAHNLPDEQLLELRRIIGRYLLEKAREKATIVWNEKGYTPEMIEKMLHGNA